MKDTEIAYIAGLFDGEGCFTLTLYKTKYSLKLQPQALVMLCDKDIISWLIKTLGFGYTSERGKLTAGWRKVYAYGTSSRKDTATLIQMILPYLRVKKYPASLVLDFCNKHIPAPRGKNPLCKTYQVPEWEIILYNKLKQHLKPSFGI